MLDTLSPPLRDTLGAVLAERAAREGDRIALICGERRTSFAELDRRATTIAAALRQAGCGPGSVIGVLSRNSDRYAEVLFGAGRAGVATLTFNWRLARPEIEFIAGEARLRLLFFEALFEEEARNLAARDPRLILVSLDDETRLGSTLAAFRAAAPALAPAPVDPHSPAIVIYTSGTTGKPKGVLISHHGILTNLAQLQLAHGRSATTRQDVALLSPPLFHIGGLCILLGTAIFGATTVVLAEAKVPDIIRAIEQHRVTRAVIIPALMPQMIDAAKRGADLGSLRTILYGMSPIPEAVLTEMLALFDCRFLQSYGMTEISGCCTILDGDQHVPGGARLTSCGRALPGTELVVRRADGSDAAIGEPGEVLLRTPSLAVGLLQQGAEMPVPLRDGWYETGDIGFLDRDGFLFLCDRKKDMIVSGGENVYSAEVERVIGEHPDVERVAVIGIPSARWGEEVKAVIVPRPGTLPGAPAIIAFAQARLARFKVPKSIDFIAEMPVTPVGKIAKNILRDGYWAGLDRRIH